MAKAWEQALNSVKSSSSQGMQGMCCSAHAKGSPFRDKDHNGDGVARADDVKIAQGDYPSTEDILKPPAETAPSVCTCALAAPLAIGPLRNP